MCIRDRWGTALHHGPRLRGQGGVCGAARGYEVPAAGEVPRLTLPPGYGDKMLTLAFERDADSYGTPRVILSSRAVEIASTAATANRLGMPAAAYMTCLLYTSRCV